MMTNICKKKNCEKEIPAGEKYCAYHTNKNKERKENIVKGALGLVALGVINKVKNGDNKS